MVQQSTALALVVVVALIRHGWAQFQVKFLVTSEVRGAVFPIDQYGTQCSVEKWRTTKPCECFGGAARRHTALTEARTDSNVIAIDTGAHFFGSGLAFPVFKGEASSDLFADAGYHAFGLTFRDFVAGVSSTDTTGGSFLAQYLNRVGAKQPSLLPAVATNLNITGDAHLTSAHVATYKIISLSGGRRMALLQLVDPTYLDAQTPHYAGRLLDFDRAIEFALEQLRRSSDGLPEVVVCSVPAVPDVLSDPEMQHVNSDRNQARLLALEKLVVERSGIDVVLFSGIEVSGPLHRKNWAGDDVVLVHVASKSQGYNVDEVSASFENSGLMDGALATKRELELKCDAEGGYADDPAVVTKLIDYNTDLQSQLQIVQGHLQGVANGTDKYSTSYDDRCLSVDEKYYCGCRVSQCGAGILIADAVLWLAGADIAFLNSGGIRSSFKSGEVTRANILEVLPFGNEVVRLENVPGSVLRAALLHSVTKLSEVSNDYASGRFLQVSSTLRFEWYFEGGDAKIGNVLVGKALAGSRAENFVPLDDSAVYKIATSSYISSGGDGFDMLSNFGEAEVHLGKGMETAVAEYLSSFASVSPGYDLSSALSPWRIEQQPSVVVLQLGSLCRAKGEMCDVVKHMVSVINDKNDGFFDNLLRYAVIVVNSTVIGCSQGNARNGYQQLAAQFTSMTGVVGPTCSDDARDVSDSTWRQQTGVNTLFMAQSTAPSLKDWTNFPYLVRTQTPEHYKVKGFQKIFSNYGWRKLGLLYDTSVWASGLASVLKEELLAGDSGAVVLNSDSESFSLQDFDSGSLPSEDLLQRLTNVNARIVFLGTQLRVQQKIFEAVYNTKQLYGQGFAWISGWINEDMLKNDEKVPLPNVIRGAEGLLGMIGYINKASSVRQQYLGLWGAVSSKAVCDGNEIEKAKIFCDDDGDVSTLSPSASFQADSVLLYAMAMDKIYRDDSVDSALLEQTMLDLASFETISGTSFTLDANGDRLGTFEVSNMQIDHSEVRRLTEDNGGGRQLRGGDSRRMQESYVALSSTLAVFKVVGQFDSISGLWWDPDPQKSVIFPGHVLDVPTDEEVLNTIITEEGMSTGTVVLIVLGVCMLASILMCAYWCYTQKKYQALRKELEQFKNTIVGVLVVTQDYWPMSDQCRDAAFSPDAPAPPTAAAWPEAPVQLQVRSNWYWAEDASRLSAHNQHDIYQPGNFVKYAGSVCAELEEHYQLYVSGGGPAKCQLNLTDRIASTGTETKAFAPESGYGFEVDFSAMCQTNLKTAFERKVLRVEVQPQKTEVAAAPLSSDGQDSRSSGQMSHARTGKSSSSQKPADLAGETVLVLHVGQLVQTSKQRPDGWSYGSVIYDEVEDRPGSTAEGISSTAGWFPTEFTGIPNAKQLEKLQKSMGGVEALAEPSYWGPVKDGTASEMFTVAAGAERQKVVDAFMTTLRPNVKVVKVERIQNMSLWQSFAVKRQTVLQRDSSKPASNFERIWLFHGTTEDIVEKIRHQGFNRSFCGRNATMYGKGVYFARDASYSTSTAYSAPDGKGVQRMFLCRVVVGEYCRGVKDGIAPDVRSGHVLYDTTVDNVKDPSIYVTYHDAQAYPEYLVHFTQ